MIIKFGPMVVGARGTAGGLIFSANLAGPYAKIWARPPNSKTPDQADQRVTFGRLATQWQGLTQAERDDWDDYADDPAQEKTNSLGETYFASGFNWYIQINLNLISSDDTERDDAPTLTRPVAPSIINLRMNTTAGGGSSRIQYPVGDPGLAEEHFVFGLVVFTLGRTAIPATMPFLVIDVPDVNRNIGLQSILEARFGNILLNTRFFATSGVQDAHGQRGPTDSDFTDAET